MRLRALLILILVVLTLTTMVPPLLADEGKIPIYEPTAITESGHYILTRDITAASGPVLEIQADGVWLDGGGHTVALSGAAGAVVEISAGASEKGIVISDINLHGGKEALLSTVAAGDGLLLTLTRVSIFGATETGIKLSNVARLKADHVQVICHGAVGADLVGGSGGSYPADSFFEVFFEVEYAVRVTGMITLIRESEIRSCQTAVELTGARTSVMEDNLFAFPGSDVCFNPQPEPPGIWLSESGGSSIRNNVFRGSDRRGTEPSPFIDLVDSGGVAITGNVIRGPAASGAGNYGVAVDAASNDTLIEANTITGCGDAGIHVLSAGNAIRNNLVNRNQSAGIFVGGSNNLVDGNRVGHNSGAGIHFDNASGPHIYRQNILRGNTGGAIGGDETNTDAGGNVS